MCVEPMAGRAAALRMVIEGAAGAVVPHAEAIGEPAPPPAPLAIADAPAGGAAYLYRKHLLKKLKTGEASARTVCVDAFFAAADGAMGVSDLALPPGRKDHAKHLEKVLFASSRRLLYNADVPMHDPDTNTRVKREFPFALPFVTFHKEHLADPAAFDPANMDPLNLPPCFAHHAVTMDRPGLTSPIGIYSDASPTRIATV